MPPLFDAGVPLEALPWGVEGDAPISSRRFRYKAEDGETDLEAYFAWDPARLEGGGGGLPGVLVAHTAIGPQEVFVHTCCDALARLGFAAFALDAFGARKCVFDKAERDALFGALRVDRTRHARRILKAYEALIEQPEVSSTGSIFGIGFCLGGMAVLDLARFRSSPQLRGWSRSTEASTDLRWPTLRVHRVRARRKVRLLACSCTARPIRSARPRTSPRVFPG